MGVVAPSSRRVPAPGLPRRRSRRGWPRPPASRTAGSSHRAALRGCRVGGPGRPPQPGARRGRRAPRPAAALGSGRRGTTSLRRERPHGRSARPPGARAAVRAWRSAAPTACGLRRPALGTARAPANATAAAGDGRRPQGSAAGRHPTLTRRQHQIDDPLRSRGPVDDVQERFVDRQSRRPTGALHGQALPAKHPDAGAPRQVPVSRHRDLDDLRALVDHAGEPQRALTGNHRNGARRAVHASTDRRGRRLVPIARCGCPPHR